MHATKKNTLIVKAPENLNVHHDKCAGKTIQFVNILKKRVREAARAPDRTKVLVCFEQTMSINASGVVYLYAQLDRLTTRYPKVFFKIQRPKRPSRPQKFKYLVDEVLNRIGIYELLGQAHLPLQEGPSVKCWKVFSSNSVDMESVMGILDSTLEGRESKIEDKVYRGLSEAVANATDHAYHTGIQSDADCSVQRHWFLSAVYDNELYIIVCDLGHGIPYTLGYTDTTKKVGFVTKLLEMVSSEDDEKAKDRPIIIKKKHSNLIHAATLIHKTRTDETHRGKGGQDMRQIVDDNKGAEMTILSRKGRFTYRNQLSKRNNKSNRSESLDGTIVGWSIPLNGDTQ